MEQKIATLKKTLRAEFQTLFLETAHHLVTTIKKVVEVSYQRLNLEQTARQRIDEILHRWENESLKVHLLKYFDALESFIDDLALEDYLAVLKTNPSVISPVNDSERSEEERNFELMAQLAHEVAVLEFKVMFK
jgi:predicted SpoU family rRNA methylase